MTFWPHQQRQKLVESTQPCYFYLKGRCKNEFNCKYRHVSAKIYHGGRNAADRSNIMCRSYFADYCKDMEKCGYAHKLIFCKYRDCHLYNECRNTHEEPEIIRPEFEKILTRSEPFCYLKINIPDRRRKWKEITNRILKYMTRDFINFEVYNDMSMVGTCHIGAIKHRYSFPNNTFTEHETRHRVLELLAETMLPFDLVGIIFSYYDDIVTRVISPNYL